MMSELIEWKSRVNLKAHELYKILNEQCAGLDLIDTIDEAIQEIIDENLMQYGTDADNGME